MHSHFSPISPYALKWSPLAWLRHRQYFTFSLNARDASARCSFVRSYAPAPPFQPLNLNDFLLEWTILLDSIKYSNTKLIWRPYATIRRLHRHTRDERKKQSVILLTVGASGSVYACQSGSNKSEWATEKKKKRDVLLHLCHSVGLEYGNSFNRAQFGSTCVCVCVCLRRHPGRRRRQRHVLHTDILAGLRQRGNKNENRIEYSKREDTTGYMLGRSDGKYYVHCERDLRYVCSTCGIGVKSTNINAMCALCRVRLWLCVAHLFLGALLSQYNETTLYCSQPPPPLLPVDGVFARYSNWISMFFPTPSPSFSPAPSALLFILRWI